MPEFLHPVVYLGDKPEKTVPLGRSIHFRPGPDYDRPYAYVSEDEAAHLIKRHGNLYALPDGPPKPMRELMGRVEVLEMAVADLAKRLDDLEKPKEGEKPKPAPVAKPKEAANAAV